MLQCAFIVHCSNSGAPNPELNTASVKKGRPGAFLSPIIFPFLHFYMKK
jgi:hypothetical protein